MKTFEEYEKEVLSSIVSSYVNHVIGWQVINRLTGTCDNFIASAEKVIWREYIGTDEQAVADLEMRTAIEKCAINVSSR